MQKKITSYVVQLMKANVSFQNIKSIAKMAMYGQNKHFFLNYFIFIILPLGVLFQSCSELAFKI